MCVVVNESDPLNKQHHVNASNPDNYFYGLAVHSRRLAQIYDHISLASSTANTVHEVGHLFGAPDHYESGQGTQQINAIVTGSPFSQDCIYGENHIQSNVIDSLTICEGCRKAMRGEIQLPASWTGGYTQ